MVCQSISLSYFLSCFCTMTDKISDLLTEYVCWREGEAFNPKNTIPTVLAIWLKVLSRYVFFNIDWCR